MGGLKIEKLDAGYGKVTLLHGVDLEVAAGEIVTLIGPNGSGKSTILKTITRQLRAMGGKVFLAERDMSEMSGNEIAKTLSMVMTERPTAELMTCREVAGTGRYPYVGKLGILETEDWKCVDEAMALVHALDVAEKGFYEISDGQRQRVMLARAICQEPEILVMDEPTSYLDMKYKLDILENIRRLAKERKMAVILSLHELDLAMKISDRIACVDGEKIAKTGTPEEIFRDDYVQMLYQIDPKCFNPLTGGLYLKSEEQAPKVFVIGGGGSGITTYYRLQREGIAFAAGILWENDLEMDAAKACASMVLAAEAFEPISSEVLQHALAVMETCESVICTVKRFGTWNKPLQDLMQQARREGKLCEV